MPFTLKHALLASALTLLATPAMAQRWAAPASPRS